MGTRAKEEQEKKENKIMKREEGEQVKKENKGNKRKRKIGGT